MVEGVKLVLMPPDRNQELVGTSKITLIGNRMNIYAMGEQNC